MKGRRWLPTSERQRSWRALVVLRKRALATGTSLAGPGAGWTFAAQALKALPSNCWATKSQFTTFQNASTYLGRTLR